MVEYYLVYIPFTPLTANDFLGLVGGEQMPGFKVSNLLVMKLVPWVSIQNPAPYRTLSGSLCTPYGTHSSPNYASLHRDCVMHEFGVTQGTLAQPGVLHGLTLALSSKLWSTLEH